MDYVELCFDILTGVGFIIFLFNYKRKLEFLRVTRMYMLGQVIVILVSMIMKFNLGVHASMNLIFVFISTITLDILMFKTWKRHNEEIEKLNSKANV